MKYEADILMFTRHLATMVRSGIPLVEAISTLKMQGNNNQFKEMLGSVVSDIANGHNFSYGLKKYPKVFNNFFTSLIEISENTGTLDQNLQFISDQLRKTYLLKQKIKTALLYPTLIVIATVVMGGFIALFILPQLVDFFSAFDIELPMSTKILLFVANSFKDFGALIVFGMLILFFVTRLVVRTKMIKPIYDQIVLKFPLFGNFRLISELAMFCRNLGVLIKSGVPAPEAIDVVTTTMNNSVFIESSKILSRSLKNGSSISDAIQKNKIGVFPPIVLKMINVGEKTGNLDESLLYLGDFYEEEIDNFSKNLATLLEPLLLLSIGLVVGVVALAIISPIYELTGSIRK